MSSDFRRNVLPNTVNYLNGKEGRKTVRVPSVIYTYLMVEKLHVFHILILFTKVLTCFYTLVQQNLGVKSFKLGSSFFGGTHHIFWD